MKIVGFNMEKTRYGLPLDNGGACLVIDGKLTAMINEERLNRKQYSSGFRLSIQYVLESANLLLEDIDLFVASSCLEPVISVAQVQRQLAENGFIVPTEKIAVCNHHISHAYSAFYASGFDEAITVVIDGDGNVLTKKMVPGTNNRKKYWFNKLQHNSYYHAHKDKMKLLGRDDIKPGENGFGGAYRYFTYFCGFPGYKYAGKLMGLSAYGASRNPWPDLRLFTQQHNGTVRCSLPDTDRLNSPSLVQKWFAEHGIQIHARKPDAPITPNIADAAFFVQRELDHALVEKIRQLIKKTSTRNVCIAGGVGLNAVTNRAILDRAGVNKLFIQPAAGDSGQCLGNALYGLVKFDRKNLSQFTFSVYQGKEYSEQDIMRTLKSQQKKIIWNKLPFETLAKAAAQSIAEGKIIGWFQGKSEIGPRALGNRSILANPIISSMKDILNARVKHRESFRPFAPSVLEEETSEWFDINGSAPFMILNAPVRKPEHIPAVTHVDRSARIQTVNKKQNERYYELIKKFKEITGVPVVLNTSFNDNEAIVEAPRDALDTFLRTGIDVLFIGDFMVEKR